MFSGFIVRLVDFAHQSWYTPILGLLYTLDNDNPASQYMFSSQHALPFVETLRKNSKIWICSMHVSIWNIVRPNNQIKQRYKHCIRKQRIYANILVFNSGNWGTRKIIREKTRKTPEDETMFSAQQICEPWTPQIYKYNLQNKHYRQHFETKENHQPSTPTIYRFDSRKTQNQQNTKSMNRKASTIFQTRRQNVVELPKEFCTETETGRVCETSIYTKRKARGNMNLKRKPHQSIRPK